jgi:diamine N-acetyltransferase
MAETVELREITAETVRQVTALAVAPDQEGYVAPNAVSIAEAYFQPKAWFRAIALRDELVGFAMVYRDSQAGEFYVWRFMIDARHQGRGYGRRAVELLVEEARGDGFDQVTLSVVPGDRSALEFYKRLGFAETGKVHGKEIELALQLST